MCFQNRLEEREREEFVFVFQSLELREVCVNLSMAVKSCSCGDEEEVETIKDLPAITLRFRSWVTVPPVDGLHKTQEKSYEPTSKEGY